LRRYGEVALQVLEEESEADRAGSNVAFVLYNTFGAWEEIEADLLAMQDTREANSVPTAESDSDCNTSNDEELPWDDPDAIDDTVAADYN
jgi:hypothetical protein